MFGRLGSDAEGTHLRPGQLGGRSRNVLCSSSPGRALRNQELLILASVGGQEGSQLPGINSLNSPPLPTLASTFHLNCPEMKREIVQSHLHLWDSLASETPPVDTFCPMASSVELAP